MDIINSIINFFVALGTMSLAAWAFWGEKIIQKRKEPKLSIQLHSDYGDSVPSKNGDLFYYHMKILNSKNKTIAHNCKVMLIKIERYDDNSKNFLDLKLAVPLTFTWAPFDINKQYSFNEQMQDIIKDAIFDFGTIIIENQNSKIFKTCHYFNLASDPEIKYGIGTRIRFLIEIISIEFCSRQCFEVQFLSDYPIGYDSEQNIKKRKEALKIIEIKS